MIMEHHNAKRKHSRLADTHQRNKKRTQSIMKHIGNENKDLMKIISQQEKASDANCAEIMFESVGIMGTSRSIHEEARDKEAASTDALLEVKRKYFEHVRN